MTKIKVIDRYKILKTNLFKWIDKYSKKTDYKLIYYGIINTKYPHKEEECKRLIAKESLSVLDIIEFNKKIFGT